MRDFKSHLQWDFLACCTRPVSMHSTMACVNCSFDYFSVFLLSLKQQQNLMKIMFSCIHFPIRPYPPKIMKNLYFILVNCTGWQVCTYILSLSRLLGSLAMWMWECETVSTVNWPCGCESVRLSAQSPGHVDVRVWDCQHSHLAMWMWECETVSTVTWPCGCESVRLSAQSPGHVDVRVWDCQHSSNPPPLSPTHTRPSCPHPFLFLPLLPLLNSWCYLS